MDNSSRDQILRSLLFVKATSKQHLKDWIKTYLDLDLPDHIVYDEDLNHEPSNSTPMDLLWEIYSKALEGTDEKYQDFLAFSARDAFKTLSASIIELLCLFHLDRNVAHLAAEEQQATKCAEYISKYLQKPVLRDYLTSKNKRTIEVTRYSHRETKEIISPVQFDSLSAQEKDQYTIHSNYVQILIATMSGVNSSHVPFMCLDELDLCSERIIKEAKMIPCMGRNGEYPITLSISSRKFSYGLVQKELDKAADPRSNLKVRHWNILDVAQSCPPTKHLPDEDKIPIFVDEEAFSALSLDEYTLLAPEEQTKYREVQGYAGCLKNCSFFSACQGRLATKQKCTSKLLKPIPLISKTFWEVGPEIAQSQLMCWKPSSLGVIFPHFSRSKHMLSADKIYEMVEGEKSNYTVTKADLIELFRSRGWSFHLGMDFGFTHNFAVILGVTDGYRLFILDVFAVAGLEINEKVDTCKSKYLGFNPTVYPDPAYPSDIVTFKRAGFRCKKFEKDVHLGINIIRSKLTPGLGHLPEMYLLAGDPGCDLLATRIEQYHWKLDAAERPTDEPDKEEDDEVDALKYMVQNLFGKNSKIITGISKTDPKKSANQNWMQDEISKLTSGSEDSIIIRGKRGKFIFEI